MTISWNWIQGTVGDIPQYPARDDRRLISALWDEGVLIGGKVTANGTDRTLSVAAPTKVIVDGDHSADQQAYLVVVHTTAATVTIDAAPGSGSRIDLIGFRVRDLDEGGDAGNDVILDKVTGVASGSPSAPATPSSFLVLATVTISAGQVAVTQGMVTDARVYTGPKDALGVVKLHAGPSNTVPNGWEIMQGQAWSSAGGHDWIADRLGQGLPTTCADTRGKVLRGVAASGTGASLRGTFGNDTIVLTLSNLPVHSHSIDHDHGSVSSSSTAHTHSISDPGHVHAAPSGNNFIIANAVPGGSIDVVAGAGTVNQVANVELASTGISIPSSGSHSHTVDLPNYSGTSGSAGSGSVVTIIPAGIALHVIIRVKP